MWLSLVEYYVRDVGAAGSNPVTSTRKSGISPMVVYRSYAAVVELADTRDLKSLGSNIVPVQVRSAAFLRHEVSFVLFIFDIIIKNG